MAPRAGGPSQTTGRRYGTYAEDGTQEAVPHGRDKHQSNHISTNANLASGQDDSDPHNARDSEDHLRTNKRPRQNEQPSHRSNDRPRTQASSHSHLDREALAGQQKRDIHEEILKALDKKLKDMCALSFGPLMVSLTCFCRMDTTLLADMYHAARWILRSFGPFFNTRSIFLNGAYIEVSIGIQVFSNSKNKVCISSTQLVHRQTQTSPRKSKRH